MVETLDDRLSCGDLIIVSFPVHLPSGHEQQGKRPALIVGKFSQETRYPMVLVVPLTTQSGEWSAHSPLLYPKLLAGQGGLPKDSIALLDQLRSIDISRISGYLGSLQPEVYEAVVAGLKQGLEF